MKKNHVKNIFFISLIFTFVIVAAVGLLFWVIQHKTAATRVLALEIFEEDSRKEEIRNLARETENLKDEIAKLDKVFIGAGQDEVVALIENLESIAKVSGVELEIESVKVTPLADAKLAKDFENVDLELKITASWSKVFHFLNLLESLPKHLAFKNMTLNFRSASDNDGFNGWSGLLEFSAVKIK